MIVDVSKEGARSHIVSVTTVTGLGINMKQYPSGARQCNFSQTFRQRSEQSTVQINRPLGSANTLARKRNKLTIKKNIESELGRKSQSLKFQQAIVRET